MVRSLEGRLAVAEAEAPARARLLLVGDFSASKVGNASVAEALAARLKQAGDVVITTSSQTLRPLRVADMVLTAWLVKNRIDVAVVDVYSGTAFRWAEWVTAVLRGANVPVVHVLRGGNLPAFARANGARVARLLAASSAVVALSGFLYEEMSAYGEIAEVIPNPIDLRAYPFRLRRGAAPRLAWLRSFHALYNPTLGPRALAELSRRLASAHGDGGPGGVMRPHLTMMGADKGDGTLQATVATAERLGVDQLLSLPGPVTKAEVPTRLAEADVFLNTTDVDNVPISVIEALACGLCVVSTDVGGIPYLLQDGVDALLVPRDDPVAMAAAVERIVEDPRLAERLSRNGRAKAESFDWSHVLPKWRTLLAKVASRQGGASRHGGTV